MTREEKLEVIYKEIADKTISPWCKIIYCRHQKYIEKSDEYQENIRRDSIVWLCDWDMSLWFWYAEWDEFAYPIEEILDEERYKKISPLYWEFKWGDKIGEDIIESYTVIWHPVMIWDVLDWLRDFAKKLFDEGKLNKLEHEVNRKWIEIVWEWKLSRKPIEDQSGDTIDFIYNLIQWS